MILKQINEIMTPEICVALEVTFAISAEDLLSLVDLKENPAGVGQDSETSWFSHDFWIWSKVFSHC